MNMNNTVFDIDSSALFNSNLSNVGLARWQRKQLQQQQMETYNNGCAPMAMSSPSKFCGNDRFIPNRNAMNPEQSYFNLTTSASKENNNDCLYESSLASRMHLSSTCDENGNHSGSKVLAFKSKAPAPRPGYNSSDSLRVMYTQNKSLAAKPSKSSFRSLPQAPERILDAPDMIDDYYLNLLDWSSTNTLAVALGRTVYLWNADTGGIQELLQVQEQDNYITSVSWIEDGSYLAVGTNYADVQLWDVQRLKQVRSMKGHTARVSSLAWNSYIVSSGSRDSTIFHHDVRVAQHHVATLVGHSQEVCGLKWSPDGKQLASGSNDNLLNIWDCGATTPRFTLDQHKAAVKAIAWCPWQSNLLASGGGTADRTIRFWNTSTGACLNSIDTESQVCSLVWSKHDKEIVSSHGFSQNQLCLWSYPSMVKRGEFTGHTSRVLHLAQSPDGTTIVSGAGDETLRFWKIFAAPDARASKKNAFSDVPSSFSGLNIR